MITLSELGLAVIVVGHVVALIQLRRAWALHSHGRPGEGGFLYFLLRRRVPVDEFVGTGHATWRSVRWISRLSLAAAGALILLRAL
jgi:hypothetical protein